MSLSSANLIFDEIEVVEEPFAGRRDPLLRPHGVHEQIAGLD